ncbi:rhomboid family intramembrane serine protease [Emticicia sp. 17c]|uniref:rhomboid family intramembrane serine protease n=1 Tax=Emticicia sp. 17c TaxID=3127704 RepID=UPI00301B9BCD
MSVTVIIIIITAIISIIAFDNTRLRNQYILNPYIIHKNNEWWRMLSSGFLHADYAHLFFNMFSLYLFGQGLERYFLMRLGDKGTFYYILLYLLGIIVANISDTFSKKNYSGYNALGASGGVSSVVFGYIMFNPTAKMGVFPIPPIIPAWIFGLLYLAYSRFMSEKQYDNIGHTAHFWGAIWGVIFVVLAYPPVMQEFIDKIISSFH